MNMTLYLSLEIHMQSTLTAVYWCSRETREYILRSCNSW